MPVATWVNGHTFMGVGRPTRQKYWVQKPWITTRVGFSSCQNRESSSSSDHDQEGEIRQRAQQDLSTVSPKSFAGHVDLMNIAWLEKQIPSPGEFPWPTLPTKAACSGNNPSCFPKTVLENHPPAKGVVHVDPQDDVRQDGKNPQLRPIMATGTDSGVGHSRCCC